MLLPWKTGRDLQACPSTRWAVKPWIAYQAITELVGSAKSSGKSTLVQTMIRAYLDHEPFLGEPTGGPGNVAVLTEEDSTTLREALELTGLLSHQRLHLIQWHDVWSEEWPVLIRKVRKDIKELEVGLLVIDTLPQFVPGSEVDTESGLQALRPLRMIAHDGTAVIMIRHERKSGGSVGKAGRGTSAIPGGVDIMLQLRRRTSKASNIRILDALSRFRATPEQTLIELDQNGRYSLVGRIASESNKIKESILATMNGKSVTIDALILATKLSRASVQRALLTMAESGEVSVQGTGKKGDPRSFSRSVRIPDRKSIRERRQRS